MAESGNEGVSNEHLIEINRRWLEEQRLLLRQREDEIQRLQAECQKIRQEMEPIEMWLARMECREMTGMDDLEEREIGKAGSTENEELRGDRLRDEVVELLREVYPNMIYYRVILNRLQERGYEVGGKDPGLNLIAHISKDKRIIRGNKRGLYGLNIDYL